MPGWLGWLGRKHMLCLPACYVADCEIIIVRME